MQNDRPRVLLTLAYLAQNGVATHLKTLSRGLKEHGWNVAIAAGEIIPGTPVDEQFMSSNGIKYHHVPYPDFVRSSKSPKQAIEAVVKLNTAIRKHRPDIIHTLGLGITPFVYPIRLLHGLPLISSCRNTPPPKIEAMAKRYSVLISLFNPVFGDRVIAISEQMRDVISELWKVSPSRIRLVPNGVNDTYFRPPSPAERNEARQSLDLDPESSVACLVGRLSWRKGQHIFVRAIAHLLEQGRPVVGLCAGEGPLQDKIEDLTADLGVSDHIRLLGYVDARQVYWASDVCVLPSRREAFANVIAEAMLCGAVPVRTPAAGAEDQIEHGVNGYVVPFDDPEALAQRIAELISNPERRDEMAARSIEVAREKFTVDAMVTRTLSVYKELIGPSQSRTRTALQGDFFASS